MATKKETEKKAPSAAALRAAAAQLEEQEKGKKKNTVIHRVIAFVLWALAAAVMYLPDIGLEIPFGAVRILFLNELTWTIVGVVAAGVLSVIGALLWKAANHIHPTKSHSKFVQFLWNQLGLIMAGIIMAPLAIILILKNDELDEKVKKVVAIVLALVFLATAGVSADYNPVTQDEVDQIVANADELGFGDAALWTRYGKSYHFDANCQALARTTEANLFEGTLQEALAANRTDACDFCAAGSDVLEEPAA